MSYISRQQSDSLVISVVCSLYKISLSMDCEVFLEWTEYDILKTSKHDIIFIGCLIMYWSVHPAPQQMRTPVNI